MAYDWGSIMSAAASAMVLNQLPTVDVGRRLCTSPHHRGPRWLPITYFAVALWQDNQKTIPKRLMSHCKTCQNLSIRERKGYQQHKPSQTGYKRRTEAEKERYRDYRREAWQKRSEAQKRDRREYDRIRAEARRRAEGVPKRSLERHRSSVRKSAANAAHDPQLDAAPLCDFIEELVHRHGKSAIARAGNISLDRVDELLARQDKTVTLELADRILTGVGYPEQLAILYPAEE